MLEAGVLGLRLEPGPAVGAFLPAAVILRRFDAWNLPGISEYNVEARRLGAWVL